MATLFGEKRFAVEVGEFPQPSTTLLRRVDLWAAGRFLTCDDNTVYVPQFCSSVRQTVLRIRANCDLSQPFPETSPEAAYGRLKTEANDLGGTYRFLDWGPTTDNVIAYLFRAGSHVVIPFSFWREAHPRPEEREVVFIASLSESELIGVLEQALVALSCNPDA